MKHFPFILVTLFTWAAHGNEDIHTINLVRVENPTELRVAISTLLFHEIYYSALISNEHLRRLHEITRSWTREKRLVWFRELPHPYSIDCLIKFLSPGQIPPASSLAGFDDIPQFESPLNSLDASLNAEPLKRQDAFRNGHNYVNHQQTNQD